MIKVEIEAISKYYGIPLRVASARYESMDKKQIEEIVKWWISKNQKEE